MGEIVNLRRARKNKARGEKDKAAEAGRTAHGVAKPVRALARARADKEKRGHDGAKLDREPGKD